MNQVIKEQSRLVTTVRSIVAASLMVLATQSPAAAPVAVVVNPENSVQANEADARALVARIFRRDTSNWPSGEDARPISREGAIQETFRDEVLGMSRSEWEQHWIRKKQRSGETPPRKVGSTRMVVRLIERDPGGITLLDKEEVERYGDSVNVLFWIGD